MKCMVPLPEADGGCSVAVVFTYIIPYVLVVVVESVSS